MDGPCWVWQVLDPRQNLSLDLGLVTFGMLEDGSVIARTMCLRRLLINSTVGPLIPEHAGPC